MKSKSNWWPFADDLETEVFDSISWNLPGYRVPNPCPKGHARNSRPSRPALKSKQ